MIKSMTGFGRCETAENNRKFTVEMKSVNHRYLDVNIKMPKKLNFFESAIRSELKNYISRGKVDLFITYEDFSENTSSVRYNKELAAEYLGYLKQMASDFDLDCDIRVSTLSKYPDVFVMEEQDIDEEELWKELQRALKGACEMFVQTRITEGEHLRDDLISKLDGMLKLVDFITERSPQIIAEYRQKLEDRVKELLGDTTVDEGRLLTEVTIFADKVCVDEELVRLRSHIETTKSTLMAGGSIGRKLDFLAQEMNREANTILSKSNDLEISNCAIELKTEIEKVRERLDSLIADNEEKYPYPADFVPGDESADKLESSCRYLERSLKELGDVNMGALSEDQSLAERLEFLGGQLKDVQQGMDELRALIANTDRQAGTMFNGALVKIDRRFDELFQRLFGGGEAHLKAQEDMDLWEAGVEIVARPPGKKPLFLAQLSGGEQSLTALSLLFASMEVAKVPLAVLDEVDAALDEANLTRFAQMVADYSKNLQVIAMTHRRQTMEHAEVMYGVTMSEPGLSQIVSVKVDQWD